MGLRSARGVVFVCAHGSRDNRCGVCGPVLIDKFKEDAELRGLTNQVFVTACSHIGGHKYAGNLIIYSPGSDGSITGHWYGYVTSDDVPELLDQHIGKERSSNDFGCLCIFGFAYPLLMKISLELKCLSYFLIADYF